MSRAKVKADDLFFFDNKGDLPTARPSETDDLSNEIGELIISSSESESICSLDDSYDSEEEDYESEEEEECDSDSEYESDESEEREEEVPLVLPDHACVYCNIYNPMCVAKCTKCSKWFCNSQKGTLSGHLINHLIKSGHKEVALHPDSPVGDATLECYNCGCKNIFLLGFIQSKEDEVMVLLCRQPCAFNAPKESDWNVENWTPLISDRRLLPWLCQHPTQAQESRARKISYEQIQKLEGAWKSGMTLATLEDIDRREQEDTLEPTKLSYSDPHEFKSIMVPLITAEAKIEKDLKEAQVNKNQNNESFIIFRNWIMSPSDGIPV
jgi:regulator of nonsense transcripts 1